MFNPPQTAGDATEPIRGRGDMPRQNRNISSGLFVYPFIKFFNTLADIMVVTSDRFELASPRCVAEDFGGEIVAINLDNGRYYSLRGFAFAVWHDLLAGHTSS